MSAEPNVIDAEFVETKDAPRAGYGRRAITRDPGVGEAAADLLETSAPLIDAVGGVAHALGSEGAAERAGHVAELARAGAEVARAAPAAVAAVRREIEPVRSAFGRLVDAAKKSGIVGERRPPVDFERVERAPRAAPTAHAAHQCYYRDPDCSPDRVCDACFRDAKKSRGRR